ncbi:MAG TPA: hypothetical protein VMU66_03845 [Gaiellales bacterium]|nr:hypothetical protein [Gaiellales bacterium]
MHAVTQRHLEQAMHVEAFSFARYMLFGRRARASGHPELADLFESLADVEVFDHFMHEADLLEFARSDVENLHAAIATEARDGDDLYRVFESQARDADQLDVAARLATIRDDKRRRRVLLGSALRTLVSSTPRPHRVLVVAHDHCDGGGLCDEIARLAGGGESAVMVVAPALTGSRLHYLASDLDAETQRAAGRLESLRSALERLGIASTGQVGDANPIVAIEDALREFPADEIVIATHPANESSWLERGVVGEARTRFGLPVSHVIVARTPGKPAAAAMTR